jgi:hypothetical protein
VRIPAGIPLALAALAVSASPAAATSDEPDLVIRLPSEPSASLVAPVFVDAYEEPGKLLYRFDAIIANQGGTLDLFRGPAGGVEQAVYPGGEPPVAPSPDVTPSGDGVVDRSSSGASFVYAYEKTHQHWHFSSAARYSLQPPGGAVRESDKIGFCMFDSYGPAQWFAYSVQGAAGERWCGWGDPSASTVRMGLSPGGADLYSAQTERQWVDITGLDPGPVVVRAEANPLHCVLESNSDNNRTAESRAIPGVRADDVSGGAVLQLSGAVVAPEVPARRSGGCVPGRTSKSCYVWASSSGPLRFAVTREPSHGTVVLAPGSDGLHAAATYTPDPGFSGVDSFMYVATDARGLVSKPATAQVRVDAAPALVAAPAPVRVRLSHVNVVRRKGRYRVQLRISAPARLSGRLERRRGRHRDTYRLRSRSVGAGPARMAIGRLARGRYRLRLLVDGKTAATAVFRVARRR